EREHFKIAVQIRRPPTDVAFVHLRKIDNNGSALAASRQDREFRRIVLLSCRTRSPERSNDTADLNRESSATGATCSSICRKVIAVLEKNGIPFCICTM